MVATPSAGMSRSSDNQRPPMGTGAPGQDTWRNGMVGSGDRGARGSGLPTDQMRPFQSGVTDSALVALRDRLAAAPTLPQLPGRPGEYGGSGRGVAAMRQRQRHE